MSKIGSVSQANNAIDMNQTLDMSGWVNVEMPEEEINRVGSKGAERLDTLASQPQAEDAEDSVAGCATLVERLYATALRKADGADSSESLRKALGVNVNGKIKKQYADLDFCRMAACNAMSDLDSLTGREIASVADGDVQPNAKAEHARALLDDAVNAQMKYATKLGELADSLPKGKSAQRTAILQLKDRTIRRAMAIVDLRRQLKDAVDKADNDYDRKLLDRRGHTDGIYLKEARQSDGLKSLQSRDNVSPADVLGSEALVSAFAELYAVYGSGGGHVLRREVLGAAAHNLIDGIKPPSSIIDAFKACERLQKDEQKAHLLMSIFPNNQANGNGTDVDFRISLGEAFAAFKASLSRYVDAKLGSERPGDVEVKAAARDLEAKVRELNFQLDKAKDLALKVKVKLSKISELDAGGEVENALRAVAKFKDAQGDWDSRIEDVKRLCSARDGLDETVALSVDDRLAIMEGTRRLSTVVEARIWNEDGHSDNELDGAVLVDCKPLGKGAFNTVKLCTFAKPDGTTVRRVFRPDSGARKSVKNGAISAYLSDPGDFSGFSYSRASERVASIFDCEDVFPRTTFGALNGEPGMFLEVAPGKEGAFFRGVRPIDVQKDPLGLKEGAETAGEIARKLNRLQWLDCLTGQVDRHMNNLMIGVGTDGNVSVKGIDNDECFPDMCLGNGLLLFDSEMEVRISGILGGGILDLDEVQSLSADLTSFPMLKSYIENSPQLKNKFVVDIAKLPIRARIERMNHFNNFGFPDHIDKDLYQKLKSVTPEEYAASLRGQNLTRNQIAAAVARFCLVRDSIDRPEQVEVYDADDWTDVDKLKKANEKNTKLDAEIDVLFRETEEKYNQKNAELQLRVINQRVNDPKELSEIGHRIESANRKFNEDTMTLRDHKQKIANITSNYYARVRCHRYLGL